MRVFLGWDPREEIAYRVARASIRRHASVKVDVQPLVLANLRTKGIYTRNTTWRDGRLWDVVSEASMSTEFAISRFFMLHLAGTEGWALFADSDILLRHDIADLFAMADDRYAVMVVQHPTIDAHGVKMDGQVQTSYGRKNWSSVMLWNLAHPAHRGLTLDMLNKAPGRDLHRFCWLQDSEIGALPATWNWLEGYSAPIPDPALVHMTRGGPWFPEWRGVAYGQEWLAELGLMTLARRGVPL